MDEIPRYRPMAFDKMEKLIKELQDSESGVPVRTQKAFLTFIPSAFMGYDLVEWIMDRFNLDDASNVEATNLANQMCQHGYFFPVNDSKNLTFKDDNSLYRFQSPYYWPWQQQQRNTGGSSTSVVCANADNVEYAIYLTKRTLRNKQRHALEEYEVEALANLKKNLTGKWDFVTMQADEQVRVAKERKKGEKIVSDSQERAYWRVVKPPPGVHSALEQGPIPTRTSHNRTKRRSVHQLRKDVEVLKLNVDRTRVKTSVVLEAIASFCDSHAPWDPCVTTPQPANPWVNDDPFFWEINNPIVDIPSEKRVERWALSLEELVMDPTGLQEFTSFLKKEYSHENIRFWLAVMDLRRSSHRQIHQKLNHIYQEFLAPGAPCEINIDGSTMEKVQAGLKNPSRFSLDAAADHVYTLLLKKDCYPRFVRSEHYKILLNAGRNIQQRKKFFGFGGQAKKKVSTSGPAPSGITSASRRRGSDRSLSGSAHELAISGVVQSPPTHSHSQSNLCDAPYRETTDDESESSTWEHLTSSNTPTGTVAQETDTLSNVKKTQGDCTKREFTSEGEGSKRHLPTQSTLDGTLRGAPPALRRLSAVEPRDFPPLCPTKLTSKVETLVNTVDTVGPCLSAKQAPAISVSSVPDVLDSKNYPDDLSFPFVNENIPKIEVTDKIRSWPATPEAEQAIACSDLRKDESITKSTPRSETELSRDDNEYKSCDDNKLPIGAKDMIAAEAPLAESEDIEIDDLICVSSTSSTKVHNVDEGQFSKKAQTATATVASCPVIDFQQVDDNKLEPILQKDICPWEDETSIEGDAPFVKTYSTLGYL